MFKYFHNIYPHEVVLKCVHFVKHVIKLSVKRSGQLEACTKHRTEKTDPTKNTNSNNLETRHAKCHDHRDQWSCKVLGVG